jgi:hypothetical protein
MASGDATQTVPVDAPVAVELWLAVRSGDVETIRRLLAADPGLTSLRLRTKDGGTRTVLHLATDWPGYFPNGPEIVRVCLEAGADPNARTTGWAPETPLHWAASSDDSDVAEALIDAGADIEAPGGSIGSPLDNAVGYACWHVARLLVARGARVVRPWHAAALGMGERLAELIPDSASPEEVSQAFWHACAGGQRRTAELLLSRGADPNWVPDYARGTPLDAAGSLGTRQENVVSWLRDLGARSAEAEAAHDEEP